MLVHGAEVPVTKCVCTSGARWDTMDPTDCEPRIGPKPACQQTDTVFSPGCGTPIAISPGTVIAQGAHDRFRRQAALLRGEQIGGAALSIVAITEARVHEIRVAAREMKIVATHAPLAIDGVGHQIGRSLIPLTRRS